MKNIIKPLVLIICFAFMSCGGSPQNINPTKEEIQLKSKNSKREVKKVDASTVVTCTCTLPNGKQYSKTKTCKVDGYCDCTTPTKPKVVCCPKPCDH